MKTIYTSGYAVDRAEMSAERDEVVLKKGGAVDEVLQRIREVLDKDGES